MTIRTRRSTVTFASPARVNGIARELPAGSYDVVVDEELIEGLSFPCYRRISTMILIPGAPPHQRATEMLTVGADDLANALRTDASVPHE